MPTPFGTLYSSNITPDGKNGIGQWFALVMGKTLAAFRRHHR